MNNPKKLYLDPKKIILSVSNKKTDSFSVEYVQADLLPEIMRQFLDDIRDYAVDFETDDRPSEFFVKQFLSRDQTFGLNNLVEDE